MSAAVILQARMGSTRLPGKVLERIGSRSVLAHCVERLRLTSGLQVIVATTTLAEDDAVVREAELLNTPVFRGADADVLDRFVEAARQFSLTEVVRATADNPAVDLDAPERTLALLRRTGVDHVVEHGLPYGTAVEAISVEALCAAHAQATEAYDREHVTPFIRRDKRCRALDAIAPGHLRRPDVRLTVDTAEDLDRVRRVLGTLESGNLTPLAAIIAAADRLAAADGLRGNPGVAR
jgi:spore coat polysaccharide biosynthesis protein SpsF (cytidylyltransferase family)